LEVTWTLARFPRRRYTPWPTPIEKLAHLSRELDRPELYIKRDDLLGLAGLRCAVPREAVVCLDEWVGAGYSLPTAAMIEAVTLLARLEGILLDPVYTGKAMAGLLELVKRGHFTKGDKVLFVHTGGSPALYAYQETILGNPDLG
jgi:D-cysteine desulfhydrase